jgi:hypothetical protein
MQVTSDGQRHGTRVPLVVTAFAAFCVLATAGECLLIVSHPILQSALYARIVPVVGWLPGLPYMFALFWALRLRWRPSASARLAALLMLALGATFGVIDFLISFHRENYGNPWLTVSAWRPLVTVALPLVWCVLLMTPRAVRFCRAGSTGA